MSEDQAQVETPEAEEGKVQVVVDREKYQESRTAAGTKSLHNGDDVASLLAGLDVDAVHEIGTECLDMDTREKYGHLNPGMQRMNVGNKLRGWVNGKQKVAEGEEPVDRAAALAAIAEPHVTKAREAAEAKAAAKAEADAAKAAEKEAAEETEGA